MYNDIEVICHEMFERDC
uniref:Uncharacterized protein n=1 Tax=Arundo donax TaxID=35708 RepID=A0A0A9C4R1_ARUDO